MLSVLGATGSLTAAAQPSPHLVTTWSASPQARWESDFVLPAGVPEALHNHTIRQPLRVSIGGERLRIVLSNAYGERPLPIADASVAISAGRDAILPGSARSVTFGGRRRATIPPGAPLVSDPVDLPVEPLSMLAVTLHVPEPTPINTFHWDARRTSYIAPGQQVRENHLDEARTTTTRVLLSAVLVEAPKARGAVVAVGDSITDGNGATTDANARWPDFLAERLAPRDVAVINAGISGARLLTDGMGENALARLRRDVLAPPGVTTAVVLIGINDISWPGTAFAPYSSRPTLAELTAGYTQLVERAHTHGIRVVGATLPPFKGALEGSPLDDYYSADKNRLRREINQWLRESEVFDAVVDLDRVLRDPAKPERLRPEFDSGDHLHPGDEGNRAIAETFTEQALFGEQPTTQ
ncbi:lipase [Spiribacter halobius]|uniref:Lipase n=2 Tax=Sediminicurvatus halobius TaxID=2182432 RepID=A0A2U2MY31_9GAMM|nr:lipase [Spiribacter halobius]